MEKKVTEDFFMLALNPKTGYYRVSGNYLTYGLLGAMVMDLALSEFIELDGKNIILKKRGVSGVNSFDTMMEMISASSREKSLRLWLRKFSVKAHRFRKDLQQHFVNNGILKMERRRFLLIPYSLYRQSDPSRLMRLTLRLKEIILYNKAPEEHELMFLGLIYACRMHRTLADTSEERRKIRKSLVKYMKDNPYAADISKTIMEMQAVITASISAAVIASSAASSSSR